MHHFLPFLLGYDILMDHFFTSGWFHHFHITTFFLAHFQVIFFKKAHPYLTKKKGHPVTHQKQWICLLRTLAASSTPSARRIPAPPGHHEPPVSRLPRPPNGGRGLRVSVRIQGISWPVVFGKMLWKYDNLLKDLFVFVGYGYPIIFFKIMNHRYIMECIIVGNRIYR